MRYYTILTIVLILGIFASTQVMGQTTGDFRTLSPGGAWSDTSIWETYNGASWVAASNPPTSADGSILVSDSVLVTGNLQIDELTIGATGMLWIMSNAATILNGNGTDLTINGELILNGNLTFNNSVTVGGTGTLINNDTLNVFDGITISSNIRNNGYLLFNGITAFNGHLTTDVNSIFDIMSGANHRYAFLTFAHGFTNHGLLRMAGYRDNWGNPITASLTITSDSLLNANDGTIQTILGHGADRVITGQVNNEGSIIVDHVLTLNKTDVAHTNKGTININGSYMIVSGDTTTFTNDSTIALATDKYLEVKNGSMLVPANGSISGMVKITNAKLGSGNITNTASFTIYNSTSPADAAINNYGSILIYGYFTVNGILNTYAGSSIRIESGTLNDTGILTVVNGLTNNGTLEMIAFNDGWGNPRTAYLRSDSAIVNGSSGTIISTKGTGSTREIEAPLINRGTINVDYILSLNEASSSDTNSGTININGQYLKVGGTGSSFTNTGTITMSDSSYLDVVNGCRFTPSNGTLTGVVKITDSELGGGNLSSDLMVILHNVTSPADATIHHHGSIKIYGYFTVNGMLHTYSGSTIIIESGSLNDTGILTVINGLTNNGLIEMIAFNDSWGNPRAAYLRSDSNIVNSPGGMIRTFQGTGSVRYIEAPFENQGTMELNYGITLNKSGNVHTNNGSIFINGGEVNIGSNNTLVNVGTIDCGQSIISGNGSFLNIPGGTLLLGSGQGITASGATGNVQVTGARGFDPLGHYVYSGTTSQASGNGLPNFVSKLTILNDSSVTLSKSIQVMDTLFLREGMLHTGSDTLSVVDSGIVHRDSGWVEGNFRKTFSGIETKTFELGTANGYSPVTVSVTWGTGSMIAKAIEGFHPYDSTYSFGRYWNISASGMTANLTFSYLDNDVVGNDSNYVLCKYDSTWNVLNGIVNPNLNTATITGMTSFSDWTLRNLTTLPMGLTMFYGTGIDTYKVRLDWRTRSENDNQGFYVERKTASSEYETVSELIPGAGTSQEEHQYTWTDTTLPRTICSASLSQDQQGIVGGHNVDCFPSDDTLAFYYRLRQVSFGGGKTYSYGISVGVQEPNGVEEETGMPKKFALEQNYPNPFNPVTVIQYSIPSSQYVRLKIYNVLGEEVATLVDGVQDAGYKMQTWDANGLPSGLYYYQLTAFGQDGILSYTDTQKLLLLK